MIAYLHGEILHIDQTSCIVRSGDIGYHVFCSGGVLLKKSVGDVVDFFIFHVVREQAQDLYGFSTHEELELFEHLTSVSGIGPKTALNILNYASPRDIACAIVRGDANHLKQIQGIGVKNAERIVIELKSKAKVFAVWISSSEGDEENMHASSDSELAEALVGLGYSVIEARQALQTLPKDTEQDIESRLKAALKGLGKKK